MFGACWYLTPADSQKLRGVLSALFSYRNQGKSQLWLSPGSHMLHVGPFQTGIGPTKQTTTGEQI
jgi:hypothetical protein